VSDEARDGEGGQPIGEAGWYLETVAEGGTLRRVRIHSLPFRVGRRHGLELVLPADSVSKAHAEIYALGPGLRLRDLGCTSPTSSSASAGRTCRIPRPPLLRKTGPRRWR
jgi:hypothetical protein